MAYNNYLPVDSEIIRKLPFLKDLFYYLFKNSSGDILRGVLFEITAGDFVKAIERLKGEMSGEIVSGDKVYVLPNCRIPLFKLKDYLEGCNAEQVSEIEECTKIIGHTKVSHDGAHQAPGSCLLHRIVIPQFAHEFKPSYWMSDEVQLKQEDEFAKICKSSEDVFEGFTATKTIVSQRVWSGSSNFKEGAQKCFITPTGVLVVYHHLSNKVPIISEDLIFERIGKPIAIDEESFKSISDMLGSEDENNHKVGAEILANCDLENSLFYIWKLAGKYQHKLNRLTRFKNIRLFIRMCKWDELARMDVEDFIVHLNGKHKLTKEYFSELVTAAAKSYSNVLQSPIFTLTIATSEHYREFGEQEFKFTKEPVKKDEVELIEEED